MALLSNLYNQCLPNELTLLILDSAILSFADFGGAATSSSLSLGSAHPLATTALPCSDNRPNPRASSLDVLADIVPIAMLDPRTTLLSSGVFPVVSLHMAGFLRSPGHNLPNVSAGLSNDVAIATINTPLYPTAAILSDPIQTKGLKGALRTEGLGDF